VNNPTITVCNPATRQKIAEVPVASAAEVRACVARARDSQLYWQSTGFEKRAKLLYRFRDLLIDEQERLVNIVTSETGKPRAEVYGNELFYMCDAIGFWAKYGRSFLSPRNIRPHLFMLKTKKVTSVYYPMGVIGIISPWNFPLVMSIGDAIPAVMAGNAVVIKPSELTPLTPLFVIELARKAGFPEGVLQVLTGGADTGRALIDLADMIAFTGSVEVGREVMRRAADRLIPVSLELGGKDAAIVLKDADLERAANACVWGALMNSGQVCTSIERVYVETPVYPAFVDKVVEKVRAIRQGPSHDDVDLGSMSSEEQFDKVAAHVNSAIAAGAKALTGGRAAPTLAGLFYEPTVLVNVNHDMAVLREETFGPVLPIVEVRDAEEALRLANESRYGLDAAVFTRDREAATRIADKLRTGSVCINDSLVNFVIVDAPMGGVKESGFGRRHGAEGIRKYCHQKTIVADRFGLKREFAWFPASRQKTEQLRRLIRLLWRSGWRNKLRSG
jgi:acyl-CoA reductase-like NAD-dependent aldehyde dehydrogenase